MPNAPRFPAVAGILLGLLLGSPLVGCEAGDPIVEIRRQQASGNYVATIEPLRALIAQRHGGAEVNFLYGRALVQTGQQSIATWSLREAMNDPEWLVPAALEIARAGLATADFNEVVAVTSRVLEQDPENLAALLYRAQARAHWRADPVGALEDAERVLALEPEQLEAYEPRILALLALERLEDASNALQEVGRRLSATDAPASSLAWHCSTTAILASDLGKVEEAETQWLDCLERYPADVNVILNAVQFYEKQGRWARSVEVLRAASAEAPTNRGFRTALATRLRVTGATAEGEALLREATEDEDPRRAAGAWSDLAIYRHALGEHGAAAEAMERAIERAGEVEEPGPQLLFRHADALVAAGQLDRALEVADEIPVAAQRQMIRARVAQERGDAANALKEFDEALRLWPDNPAARYYAAVAAERVGDFDRAVSEYRYALRISVGATDARTRVARLLVAQGQPLLAYQLLFLEVARAPLEPEGVLLSMYLMGRVANATQLQQQLTSLAGRDPGGLPAALAEGADGVADRAGPGAALTLVASAPGLDFTAPYAWPALRALIRYAHAAEQPEVAERAVAQALAARPEQAVFHTMRGLHVELGGGELDDARAAYRRAIQIEPSHALALTGLGRLLLEGDPEEALRMFDRAAAADPTDPEPSLGAARALAALGQADPAVRRLDALLVEHPTHREAAELIVSLDLERGSVTNRTLDRAHRAVRFGGGVAALDRLSEVYAALERPSESDAAARQAQRLREQAEPGVPTDEAAG